jgi:hypothetical protein
MSYKTATLTDAEVNVISNPAIPYWGAGFELESLSASLRANEDEFYRLLRIRNTLWEYEEKAKTEPSEEVLAVLLNGEYWLWYTTQYMTEGLDIEVNPFLTHWVEAIMRMENAATKEPPTDKVTTLTTNDISRIRVAFIKELLDGSADGAQSPHEALQQAPLGRSFDIRKYMQILVETGVWRDSDMPEPQKPTSNGKTASHGPIAQKDETSGPWQQVILRTLEEQPNIAVQEIARLPLQLEQLEFLNKLLADGTLEAHSLEPSAVITPYIQHALRLVENMEAPPNGPVENGSENGAAIVEYGKDAQRRAVNLLLLFIKNLICKDLMGIQSIYFEIEEICVRYVWIKEVRDFRSWVEEGS